MSRGWSGVRGMYFFIARHSCDELCKVRLLGAWIKRREILVGARRIRSEKLREHQYKERHARSLEGKKIEWYGADNVEHMWEHVKRA